MMIWIIIGICMLEKKRLDSKFIVDEHSKKIIQVFRNSLI